MHEVHQISLCFISSGDSHHTNLFHFPIACRECWGKSQSNLQWMGEQWIVVFRSYDISFLLCKCVKLHIFINTENFFILVICVNLKRIGRWPDNKVIDISDLMTKQQPISKHKKEETQPWRKEKAKAKTKLRSSMNNNDSHKHVQRPSIAKCMLLTIYHDSPTDFTSCQWWTQPTHWSFCHKTSSNWQTQQWCWLTQQNLKEKTNPRTNRNTERKRKRSKNVRKEGDKREDTEQ